MWWWWGGGVTFSELSHQECSEDLLSVQPHFLSAAQKQNNAVNKSANIQNRISARTFLRRHSGLKHTPAPQSKSNEKPGAEMIVYMQEGFGTHSSTALPVCVGSEVRDRVRNGATVVGGGEVGRRQRRGTA